MMSHSTCCHTSVMTLSLVFLCIIRMASSCHTDDITFRIWQPLPPYAYDEDGDRLLGSEQCSIVHVNEDNEDDLIFQNRPCIYPDCVTEEQIRNMKTGDGNETSQRQGQPTLPPDATTSTRDPQSNKPCSEYRCFQGFCQHDEKINKLMKKLGLIEDNGSFNTGMTSSTTTVDPEEDVELLRDNLEAITSAENKIQEIIDRPVEAKRRMKREILDCNGLISKVAELNTITNPRDKSIKDIATEISQFDKSCNEVQKTELIDMKQKVSQLKSSIQEVIDNIDAVESAEYIGCFNVTGTETNITSSHLSLDNMTRWQCDIHCFKDHGYMFAALSGSSCHCGNAAPEDGDKVEDEHCDDHCPGDATKETTCGGSGVITVLTKGEGDGVTEDDMATDSTAAPASNRKHHRSSYQDFLKEVGLDALE